MRFPSVPSAFEIDVMFQVLPNQPSVAPVTVSGFTRHKTQVADLPPGEQVKLNALADRIVNGFRTGNFPIVGILFAGHSDQDLARGAAFEREISLERAGRVRDALLRAALARAGPGLLALQVKEVIMRTVGLGANRRVFTNPVNETQRATNRRVVMFIAEANLPSVSLLGETFPVPPQKHQGVGSGLDLRPAPQRSSVLLAFSVPLFGAPPLAGAPVFVEGPPRRPNIKHDHGFLDDGTGNIDNSKKQSPTDRDRDHKEVWRFVLGVSIQRRPELKDANDAYKHFLVDNNGAQFTVRYDGFLKEDTNGQTVLKSAIDDTRTGVLDVFDKKFPKPATVAGRETFQVTSTPKTVGAKPPLFDPRYPYPASENWQKAIGGHSLWLSAMALIDSNPVTKTRTVAITMTLHAEDMYNFNPDATDIATDVKDSENGRFEIVSLGTEFLQIGTATRTIAFTIPNAKQADNRVVPADQKVT